MFEKSTQSIKRLTWIDDDIHTSDTCGMKYGDHVLFIREFMEGSSRSVAMLNNNESVVKIISEAPQPTDWGGCMARTYLNKTLKLVYIGDETKGEFGKKSAFSLDLTTSQNEPHIERLFDVPLINTSIADFALSLQYCTSLLDSSNEPMENIVLCNSAVNNTISILDATTGSSFLNLSVPENRDSWDMTQYSYQAFCL